MQQNCALKEYDTKVAFSGNRPPNPFMALGLLCPGTPKLFKPSKLGSKNGTLAVVIAVSFAIFNFQEVMFIKRN